MYVDEVLGLPVHLTDTLLSGGEGSDRSILALAISQPR